MKKTRNIGAEILEGIRQVKRGETGRVVNLPDVKSIREQTGLSQSRFATLLGVSVRTLQDWEQGRRSPSGAARTLLLLANRDLEALLDALEPIDTPFPDVDEGLLPIDDVKL